MITPFVDVLGPPKPRPSTLRLSTLVETLGAETAVGVVIDAAGAVGDEDAAGADAGAGDGEDDGAEVDVEDAFGPEDGVEDAVEDVVEDAVVAAGVGAGPVVGVATGAATGVGVVSGLSFNQLSTSALISG